MSSDSLFAKIMAPGGGMILVPFTRGVTICLFLVTFSVFLVGTARIHMAIMSVLSLGMWIALGIFEKEYSKAMRCGVQEGTSSSSTTKSKKKNTVTSSKRED